MQFLVLHESSLGKLHTKTYDVDNNAIVKELQVELKPLVEFFGEGEGGHWPCSLSLPLTADGTCVNDGLYCVNNMLG